MADQTTKKRIARCACGGVELTALGKPILSAVCYCDDCRAGGRQIEGFAYAPKVLDPDGGAAYLTYRDDRIECTKGEDRLVGHKIKQQSKTTRYVASCCNSAMYVKFAPGHWVSAYRNRFGVDVPALEMRTQTQFRQSDLPMSNEPKCYKKFPMTLFGKLIWARLEMLMGR